MGTKKTKNYLLTKSKILSKIRDFKEVSLLLVPHLFVSLTDVKIHSPIKYIIFRLDDIQDYWLRDAQLSLMDLFLFRKQNLSLGLIMNSVGKDLEMIEKIKEGEEKGLFEVAIHGWDHLDYSSLSEQQQNESLERANQKIMDIFGHTATTLIAPYGLFNDTTVKVLPELGIHIISANSSAENTYDGNRSVFIAKGDSRKNKKCQQIFHLPSTVPFKLYLLGRRIDIPLKTIITRIRNNIHRCGYGVIVLHPQDFVKIDKNGNFTEILEQENIQLISNLIDLILSKEIRITAFPKLVGLDV
jgi:peptidoglycan/xylan/chitin deacetylase (PgdA/CDA1 family)